MNLKCILLSSLNTIKIVIVIAIVKTMLRQQQQKVIIECYWTCEYEHNYDGGAISIKNVLEHELHIPTNNRFALIE